MPTLVVKNLPEALHEKLRRQAENNHRSVTKEVVSLIEAGVVAPPPSIKLKSGRTLSIEEIDRAVTDNRYARLKSLAELNQYMDELRADRQETSR